jgi:hypothetical protein
MNSRFGDQKFSPNRKNVANRTEHIPEIKKQLVIISFFFFVSGRNRTNPILNPRVENETRSVIADIIAVAYPISLGGYNLAHNIQKKNPNPDVVILVAIR